MICCFPVGSRNDATDLVVPVFWSLTTQTLYCPTETRYHSPIALPDIFDGQAMQTFLLYAMINVQALPPTGALIGRLCTNETERAELALRFGYLSVDALSADLRIKRAAKGAWNVLGKLHAEITQACIVTGDPVSESVDFEIEERYVLASVAEDEIVVDLGDAEPLVNGCIDIGEMIAQMLALSATAWPRSKGAPDNFCAGEDGKTHPFASLSSLKSPEK